MTRQQFESFTAWQEKTFPGSTSISKLSHLSEEIIELKDSIKIKDGSYRHEFADCFLLLFGSASASGMTYDDILDAIDEKMSINLERKWEKPNADGVVHHIKDINQQPNNYYMTHGNDTINALSQETTDRVDAGVHIYTGLTKREYFAAMAMQGMLSNNNDGNNDWSYEIIGKHSVLAADALIKALNQQS
jgi:NTP pyrophosphatase (non-canonical NTP hydrolase)